MSTRRRRGLEPEELSGGTAYGELYLRRLRRAQLGLTLLALAVLVGAVGALPLLLLVEPEALDVLVLGVPLDVLLVAVPPFGLFVVLGWLYARRADALDDDFRDLVER